MQNRRIILYPCKRTVECEGSHFLICDDEIIRLVTIISYCNLTLIYVGAIQIFFAIEESWFIRSGIGTSKQQLEVIAPEIIQYQRIMTSRRITFLPPDTTPSAFSDLPEVPTPESQGPTQVEYRTRSAPAHIHVELK